MQHSRCGNKYLEKIAVDWGSVGDWALHHGQIGLAVHLGQNQITDKVLKHVPHYHRLFSDYFHAGLQGKGYPGKAHVPKKVSAFGDEFEFAPGELAHEAQHIGENIPNQGYVKPTGGMMHKILGFSNPELQVMLEEAHHAGHQSRMSLLDQATNPVQHKQVLSGLNEPMDIYQHMGRRSAAIYARALRGDFTHLHDMASRYPGLAEQIRPHLYDIEKRTTYPITQILSSRKRAQDIERAYKENPITGNLMASLSKKPRDVTSATENMTRRGSSLYQGAGLMALADPVAGALNASKLVLSDKPQVLNKSPMLKNISDKLGNKYVTEPIAAASNDGLNEGKRHKWYYRLLNKSLKNNAVGHMEDVANSIGYEAGKHTKGIRKALAVGEDVQ